MKIAVVGTGISGLSCAWLLSQHHDVVLFEREQRAGGHTNTVTTPNGQWVDTGFIVYNEHNYPNLTAMFSHLNVASQDSDMSFGVSIADGAIEYAGDNLATLFAQPSNLVSPRHWGMLMDILRFNAKSKKLLREDRLPDISLGAFIDQHGYGKPFAARYLLPMAGAIWSCSPQQARAFPYPDFARFFDSHGLLNAVDRPQWRMVSGGSCQYVTKLLAAFKGQIRIGETVNSVKRLENSVIVTSSQGSERYDALVCATHSDQALALLDDADAAEQAVLGAISYAPNHAYLHTDTSLLPKRRSAWSSWNYLGSHDIVSAEPVAISYWMNRLQNLPGPQQYVVSLNPPRPPEQSSVIYQTVYEHPQFCEQAMLAQRKLHQIQGKRGVWFCGAWTGYGFHEDGLKSGLSVAAALGCPPPWPITEPVQHGPTMRNTAALSATGG